MTASEPRPAGTATPDRRQAVIAALRASGLVGIDPDQTDRVDDTNDEPRCRRCGLGVRTPGVAFDLDQVCIQCRHYTANRERIDAWFQSQADLIDLLKRAGPRQNFDCMLLYSGGKDSTYALYQLVEMGLAVTTFTLDNGFISARALDNIERVTTSLGIAHQTLRPPGVGETIRDSLARLATPCAGCFRSLLDHALARADTLGVRHIVTGLSRGQIMRERLEWFHARNIYDPAEIEASLEDGRRVYHHAPGFAGLGLWNATRAETLNRVKVIDFYRYTPVRRDEILAFLVKRDDVWRRADDCGFCSTNCLINDPGIALHTHQKGWHSYEGSNAWEVRLGHTPRAAAVADLAAIDPATANAALRRLGLPGVPAGSDGLPVVRCAIASDTTDAQVRSYLDSAVPGWDAAVRLLYRDGVVPRPRAGAHRHVGLAPPSAAAIEHTARWRGLAAMPRAWTIREHVLLALPHRLAVAEARHAVLAALTRHRVARLGPEHSEAGVAVRHHAAGALRTVRLDAASPQHHRAMVARLIQADAAQSRHDGPALQAVLLDREAAGPWLLLSASALLTGWSDWWHLVADIGATAAAASGLAPAAPPRRRARFAAADAPPVAIRTDAPPGLVLPTYVARRRLRARDATGAAPALSEWLDGHDRMMVAPPAHSPSGIGLRLVDAGETCLPAAPGMAVLMDPHGRWLSDRAAIQLVVEPADGGWLAHAHAAGTADPAAALLADPGLVTLLTRVAPVPAP